MIRYRRDRITGYLWLDPRRPLRRGRRQPDRDTAIRLRSSGGILARAVADLLEMPEAITVREGRHFEDWLRRRMRRAGYALVRDSTRFVSVPQDRWGEWDWRRLIIERQRVRVAWQADIWTTAGEPIGDPEHRVLLEGLQTAGPDWTLARAGDGLQALA